jgi:DNA-binding winged helix-turn-helix (wHTH) protein
MSKPVIYEFGPYRLNLSQGRLFHEGRELFVRPRIWNLLSILVQRHGQIVAKQELRAAVWGRRFLDENNLNVSMSEMRKLLQWDCIETIPRRGYRFSAPVRIVDQEPSSQPISGRYLCFGAFQMDLGRGWLYRNGLKVNLSNQSFHILQLLTRQPGEVVTREELKKALWGPRHADFDAALNTLVKNLRIALGDSPRSPKFIKTSPLRGYCFIAPVEELLDSRPAQPAASEGGRLGAKALAVLRGYFQRFKRSSSPHERGNANDAPARVVGV